jgi:regulator of sigma E protease
MDFMITAMMASLVLIAILVGVHELGHFLVARHLGVKVLQFSIGFGKQVIRYVSSSGITYAISLLPLGGYVKMLDTREGPVSKAELSKAFDQQALWKRLLIVIAGPLFNIIFALLALWLVFLIGYKAFTPVIPALRADSPMAVAGVKVGMEIVEVAGYSTPEWADVTVRFLQNIGSQTRLPIVVRSGSQLQTLVVDISRVQYDDFAPDPLQEMGVIMTTSTFKSLPFRLQQYGPLQAMQAAYHKLMTYSYFCVLVIKKLLTATLSVKSLSGPIGLFAFAGNAWSNGLVSFLFLLALISIIIAIVNLLPFPGLDGGHLLYLLVEAVQRKPVTIACQVLLFRFSLIGLGLLFVQIVANDLQRLSQL